MKFIFFPTIAAVCLLGLCSISQAHPGHDHPAQEVDEFEENALRYGLFHPFTGVDHLVVMLAIGAIACTMGARSGSAMATLFVGSLGLGTALGLSPQDSLLVLSVVVPGSLLVIRAGKNPRWCLAAGIGLWQGAIHGTESSGVFHALGLCVGTAAGVILGAALASALWFCRPRLEPCN